MRRVAWFVFYAVGGVGWLNIAHDPTRWFNPAHVGSRLAFVIAGLEFAAALFVIGIGPPGSRARGG